VRGVGILGLLVWPTACGMLGPGDCALPPINGVELQPEKVMIQEGVWGQLSFWDGDFTPGNYRCPRGTITAVGRVVLVFEPTLGSMSTPDSTSIQLLTSVSTSPIDSASSDETGFFEIAIPPGEYSLFVREGDLLYSMVGGAGGVIHTPLVVEPNKASVYDLRITYRTTS
jgi:hypothetical protein